MQLMIFRHGIAEDHSPDGSDASRRLTDEGVEKTKQAAEGLAQFADRPDVILSSPLVRARQTAQIVGTVFDRTPQTLDVLAEPDPRRIIDAVAQRSESVVMIVGHEPSLSGVVELLCAPTPTGKFVQMKKAGCACVELDLIGAQVQAARLLWLATPRMLRAAGG